jgi:SHS2 domain-containing protein
MPFELLAHPADVKLRSRGRTIEDAFTGVVDAVAELVGGVDGGAGEPIRREIELEARSHEALLFDFLDRLILLQDIDDAVVTRASSVAIEETDAGYRLSAVVQAVLIPAAQPLLDLKAPTYSEMRVEGNGEWTIEAVIDV